MEKQIRAIWPACGESCYKILSIFQVVRIIRNANISGLFSTGIFAFFIWYRKVFIFSNICNQLATWSSSLQYALGGLQGSLFRRACPAVRYLTEYIARILLPLQVGDELQNKKTFVLQCKSWYNEWFSIVFLYFKIRESIVSMRIIKN